MICGKTIYCAAKTTNYIITDHATFCCCCHNSQNTVFYAWSDAITCQIRFLLQDWIAIVANRTKPVSIRIAIFCTHTHEGWHFCQNEEDWHGCDQFPFLPLMAKGASSGKWAGIERVSGALCKTWKKASENVHWRQSGLLYCHELLLSQMASGAVCTYIVLCSLFICKNIIKEFQRNRAPLKSPF